MRRRPVLRVAALVAVLVGSLVPAVPAAAASPSHLPTVIGTRVLGYSVEHRPIIAYHLGNPASPDKAVLLGQMHGDEHAGLAVADAVLHGGPLTGVDLWVIPTMNPDGNVADTRQNAHGVDLNRNWPNLWAPLSGEYYSGASALSEPETRAMYDFLVAFRPDRFISIHQPLFAVDTTDGGARNPRLARQLATELGLPLSPLRCWSTCRGSMTGWLTTHQAGFADTVEFGAAPSAGYLRGQATRAILHALGAVADTAARHDPALSVTALRAAPGQVTVAGAAQDPDRSGSRVRVSVTEHGRLVASVYAQTPRPTVTVRGRAVHGHGFAVSLAATPGRHVYCITAHNLGYGAGNTTRCRAVTVPPPATASAPAP